MKFTKVHQRQLSEFMDVMNAKGCVAAEDWTTGNFSRYKSAKALPPFVTKVNKDSKLTDSRYVNQTAKWFFRDNPRRKTVLVLDIPKMNDFLMTAALGTEF